MPVFIEVINACYIKPARKIIHIPFLIFLIIFEPVEAFLLKIFKPIHPIASAGVCFIVKMTFGLAVIITARFFIEIAITLDLIDIDPASVIVFTVIRTGQMPEL